MPPVVAMQTSATAHLDADTLAAYVDGRLAEAELGRADRHIDACRSCRLELSTLAAIHTQPAAAHGTAPEGTLGRYHVLRELGRGSMGIVLRAYDPELARPVAIKLVRDVDAETRDLLRREARALAKLRHPNVVTVYDVIVEADALYVAMELVEGDTLRGHCKGKPTADILAACVRAGRGLAAAHDAGVIHRDFKPENVLCGEAGEVKVSDFGLARAADETPDGALAGTPAYMAPEVLRREPATALSDQFSFCVATWEMLTGDRPTGGAPKASLAFAPVPAWVIRVLRRGLERDPASRFPSMHALVAALEDDPLVRRRRRVLLGAGAVAALATGALAMSLAPRNEGAQCTLDERALGDAWTIERRTLVTASLTANSDADTARRVVAALDAHAADWLESRRDTCIATRDRGESAANSRRLACLDRTRRQLGALAQVLSQADAKLAGNALEAVGQLPDPAACATSSSDLPDDVAGRVLVEEGRTLLARATALQWAGKGDEADPIANQVLDLLGPDIAPSLRAETLLVRARVEGDRGRYDSSEALLFEALHAAERGRDDMLVATLWVEIVNTTGALQHRFELALSNARAADAALARVEPGTELQLRYAYALGTTLMAHGKLDGARKRLESVKGIGASEPRRQAAIGLIELALCDIARQQGRLSDAHAACEAGMKRLEDVLGPNHIRVAISLSQLGALAFADHDLAAAQKIFDREVSIFEAHHAEEHYAYALALSNLGAVYSERGEVATAERFFTRSLSMFDAHHPTHPQRLMPMQGLAAVAMRRRDMARAVSLYRQVRDLRAATYAPEHVLVLGADYNLALAYRNNKQPAEARALLADLATRAQTPGKETWIVAGRALDTLGTLAQSKQTRAGRLEAVAYSEQAVAAMAHVPETAEHAYVKGHLGERYIHAKRFEDAVTTLEAVLAYHTAHHGSLYDIGATRALIALAMLGGGDRDRCFDLAAQARDELAKARSGEDLERHRANIARMLAVEAKQRRRTGKLP
jgi:tetratricopeptide (TPR) repeat protein